MKVLFFEVNTIIITKRRMGGILRYLCALFYFTLLFSTYLAAQTTNLKIDSLKSVLQYTSLDTEKVNILIGLSNACLNDSSSKLKYANDAKLLAEKINWLKGISKANIQLGGFYYTSTRNYAKALEYFQNNILIAQNNKDKIDQAISMELAAKCYEALGQHKKSLEYFYKALALNPDPDTKTGIYGDMGSTYTIIGDYTHALTCYVNSLKLLDEILLKKKTVDVQDTYQKAGLLLNIGDIYLAMPQPEKAFENYINVLAIGRALKDKEVEILSLNDLGKTYKAQKNYSKAIETFNNALEEARKVNNYKDQSNTLYELANLYLETGNISMAVESSHSALKIVEEHNYSDYLPKLYTTLGQIYLKQRAFSESVVYLQKALAICQKTGELENEQTTLQALSTAYEQMNQPVKALEAYRSYIDIRDSLHSIDKANELTRIDLEYGFNEEKIKQNAVYNEKIQRQRIFTYASFAGAALVLLLSFFIYRNYNTQKKYNALLKKEQERQLAHISAQDTVLSDIAHVQSHFVRGPIATILGLLQLYNHEDPSDPINKEVVEGINFSIEKLDNVVKDVVIKENKLRRETKT